MEDYTQSSLPPQHLDSPCIMPSDDQSSIWAEPGHPHRAGGRAHLGIDRVTSTSNYPQPGVSIKHLNL